MTEAEIVTVSFKYGKLRVTARCGVCMELHEFFIDEVGATKVPPCWHPAKGAAGGVIVTDPLGRVASLRQGGRR